MHRFDTGLAALLKSAAVCGPAWALFALPAKLLGHPRVGTSKTQETTAYQ